MALPAGIRSGTPEATEWVLAQAAMAEEASALGLTVAGSAPTAKDRKARATVAAANLASHKNFYLRTTADELGVTLSEVVAAGGMITAADIRRKAGLIGDPVAAAAPMARLHGFAASGPRGANPAVEAAHRDRPKDAVKAAAKGPEPQMFSAGALPAFIASGVDPHVLASLPANARHHVAKLGTAAEVFAAVEDFVGMSDQDAMVHASASGMEDDDYRYYKARVASWLVEGLTDGEIYQNIGYNDPSSYRT